MPDLLHRLASAPIAGRLTRALGLPEPTDLARPQGGYKEAPLAGQRVISSETKRLQAPLAALGAGEMEAGEAIDGLVLDATQARAPAALDDAYAFLQASVEDLAPRAKVLVLAPSPTKPLDPEAGATARALEGFTRSLAKELGRQGATANVLRVGPDAEDRLIGPLRYLLTQRSAYVSGQALALSGKVAPSDPSAQGGLLAGKRAIVTGAARGLGEATARRLAEEGAHVIGVDLPSASQQLTALTDEIDGEAVTVDITDQEAASVLDPPDVMVHNAGITRDKIFKRLTPEMW